MDQDQTSAAPHRPISDFDIPVATPVIAASDSDWLRDANTASATVTSTLNAATNGHDSTVIPAAAAVSAASSQHSGAKSLWSSDEWDLDPRPGGVQTDAVHAKSADEPPPSQRGPLKLPVDQLTGNQGSSNLLDVFRRRKG